MPTPEAGWYDDPDNPERMQRWWDGQAWTDHRHPKPPAETKRLGDTFFSATLFGHKLHPALAAIILIVIFLFFFGMYGLYQESKEMQDSIQDRFPAPAAADASAPHAAT